MPKISRALISLTNKEGIEPFARVLRNNNVEILSTGGTAKVLKAAAIPVIEIGDYTGFPEMLDGRVKTLHPKIHGGLLYLRGNPHHESTVEKHGIKPIDLVVVNLYDFKNKIKQPDVTLADLIESVDIGGPSMLRSAAKNYQSVTVVVDPADYNFVADFIMESSEVPANFRFRLAAKAIAATALYDTRISQVLGNIAALEYSPLKRILDGAPIPAEALYN